MMNEPKKVTASHLVLYISWIVLIVYTAIVLRFVFVHVKDITPPTATILGALETMLAGEATLVTRAYYKKSGIEYQIKSQLFLVQGIIDLQLKYPWLNLLANQDVSKIIGNVQSQIQKSTNKDLESTLSEDIGTKIL